RRWLWEWFWRSASVATSGRSGFRSPWGWCCRLFCSGWGRNMTGHEARGVRVARGSSLGRIARRTGLPTPLCADGTPSEGYFVRSLSAPPPTGGHRQRLQTPGSLGREMEQHLEAISSDSGHSTPSRLVQGVHHHAEKPLRL